MFTVGKRRDSAIVASAPHASLEFLPVGSLELISYYHKNHWEVLMGFRGLFSPSRQLVLAHVPFKGFSDTLARIAAGNLVRRAVIKFNT